MFEDASGAGFAALAEMFGPSRRADPYPDFKQLRTSQPIWQPLEQLFVLSRHHDCSAVLRDVRFGHADQEEFEALKSQRAGTDECTADQRKRVRSFLGLNPPDHTRMRRLVSTAFTPRRVEELAPRIEQLTNELLAVARTEDRPVDLIEALASPLPLILISELLGVPLQDRDRLVAWSHAQARGLDPDFLLPTGVREQQTRAREELGDYLHDLVTDRRRRPGTDLLSALVAVHDQGDTLSEDELVATCILILIAGHETTSSLIGTGVLALLQNPDQFNRLSEEPELIEQAVEELLRYDSPIQLTLRAALQDADIGDVAIPRNAFVLLLVGSANRDPDAYPDPDRLDIGRAAARHLAFGHGIHFCLGAPLARLEAQIVLRSLSRSTNNLRLAGQPVWKENLVLRGLQHLPVDLS
jgi:cytochrome P450